jgi:hypothetical protein
MPKRASVPFSSRPIPARWHWQLSDHSTVEDRPCDSGLAGELEDQWEVIIDLRISTARSVAA